MLKSTLLLFTLLFAQLSLAQSASSSVLNTAGGSMQNTAHLVEWSLGELAVTTISSANNQLTQGFLQPLLVSVGIENLVEYSPLLIFPNPVTEQLHLKTEQPGIEQVRVYDLAGKLVLERPFQPILELQMLPAGAYIVTLSNKQGRLLQSFKINKI